jgi:hypothetical protein
VQEPVQLAQRRGAVAAEDGHAGGPQPPAPERVGALDDGRQGCDVDVRWATPPARADDGVELLAELRQAVHDGPAPDRELEQLGVDPGQLGDEVVSFGLDLHTGPQAEPGLSAEELDGGATEPIRVGREMAHAGLEHRERTDGCRSERAGRTRSTAHLPHPV